MNKFTGVGLICVIGLKISEKAFKAAPKNTFPPERIPVRRSEVLHKRTVKLRLRLLHDSPPKLHCCAASQLLCFLLGLILIKWPKERKQKI